jgi:hypothetical protein
MERGDVPASGCLAVRDLCVVLWSKGGEKRESERPAAKGDAETERKHAKECRGSDEIVASTGAHFCVCQSLKTLKIIRQADVATNH